MKDLYKFVIAMTIIASVTGIILSFIYMGKDKDLLEILKDVLPYTIGSGGTITAGLVVHKINKKRKE